MKILVWMAVATLAASAAQGVRAQARAGDDACLEQVEVAARAFLAAGLERIVTAGKIRSTCSAPTASKRSRK